MHGICIVGGLGKGREGEGKLELDELEAIAAAQMDGEVPSMSGSHGNLSERSHHRRELRVMVTTSLAHFTLHFTQRQSVCLPEEEGG